MKSRNKQNVAKGDIVTITDTRGHGFKMGEKVKVVDTYWNTAHCYNVYYQYVGYHQFRKQIVLNKETKTI